MWESYADLGSEPALSGSGGIKKLPSAMALMALVRRAPMVIQQARLTK